MPGPVGKKDLSQCEACLAGDRDSSQEIIKAEQIVPHLIRQKKVDILL